VEGLNETIRNISEYQGKLDGLIAAAGIQQETPALDYTQADANMMFEVNVTGKSSNKSRIGKAGGADIAFLQVSS